VPQKTLKDLINQVHFAMAVHDIRYYLNGILFIAEGKTLTLVATDGHRLGLAQATLETDVPSKQEVILPRKTVLELQRLLKDEDTPSRCALPATRRASSSRAWSSSPSWSRASSPTTTA
jgi:DNA polymerase-3 subunit beta